VFENALLAWIWLGSGAFLLGCAWRAWRYARTPVHLRWDLYPVAHDPRREHGGSHLEVKDWWSHPRKTSLLGEAVVMAEEIVILKGVFRNNRRVWWGSLPFHWGLYLMMATTLGLVAISVGIPPRPWLSLLEASGTVGGALLALGSAVLLYLRSRDPRLRPYTSPLDLGNLALLLVLGALSFVAASGSPGMLVILGATTDVLHGRAPGVPPLLATQMGLAALFVMYLPATRMVHFFSKYFTYHEVRWDDRPREVGSRMDHRLAAALDFGVSWSAPHVGSGGTWAEVTSGLPEGKE
jgi:nitrate reductase gamma subunit